MYNMLVAPVIFLVIVVAIVYLNYNMREGKYQHGVDHLLHRKITGSSSIKHLVENGYNGDISG